MKKIPSKINIGGQEIEIRRVERCSDNEIGKSSLAAGLIEIADLFNVNREQSETSKHNTFYHELTHAILDTMGENKLSSNEKFVCCFSAFLTEAMKDAYFVEKDEQ